MVVLGLTGSIGMGKTTTARFFAEAGVPVFDADAAVHRLYAGEAVAAIEAAFPGTTTEQGVDRGKLAQAVVGDPAALTRLEAIIHPLVRREELRFIDEAEKVGAPVVVLDIPLLFETGRDSLVDAVVVVSAPPEVQRARVFERPGMTEGKFRVLLEKQMPDEEKRRRAAFVVDSSGSYDSARAQVHAILRIAEGLPIRRREAEY
jgi:dephospho-CoA kinase